MRIAVMGTGGVGGYFGALLARSGEEVVFIARGRHLQAILDRGLRVESVHGSFVIAPANATGDPGGVGPVDLILFATKTYQIDDAVQAMRPLVGPTTTVLPLQNGVDAAERVAAVFGARPVVGGVCYVASFVEEPGLIRQQSQFRRIVAGELDGRITPRVEGIVTALARAGVTAEASPEIQKARWTKYAFIAPFSAVGAVARVPAGELMGVPETRSLLEAAVGEVEAVARARSVGLDPHIVSQTMAFCQGLAPGMTASMQRDILDGRPSELESLIGHMVREGKALGVPVPVFALVYAALLPQENRARGAGSAAP